MACFYQNCDIAYSFLFQESRLPKYFYIIFISIYIYNSCCSSIDYENFYPCFHLNSYLEIIYLLYLTWIVDINMWTMACRKCNFSKILLSYPSCIMAITGFFTLPKFFFQRVMVQQLLASTLANLYTLDSCFRMGELCKSADWSTLVSLKS